MKNEEKHWHIYILLLLVPLFWGAAFGAAAHVVTEIGPLTAAALRFGIAGVILLLLTIQRKEWKLSLIKKHWLGLLCMAITGIFLYNAFFFIGLQHTSPVNGSLLIATTPVFITLSAVVFLHEAWSSFHLIGLSLALIGVILVIINGSLHTLLTLSFNNGDLLFIGALLSWVFHGLIGKVVMKELSPLITTTVTTLIGSVALIFASFYEKSWGQVFTLSTQASFEMIFMILFSTVIAFLLWNKGIAEIGASKASIYMNLVPINAAWIAVILYGESISLIQIFGMFMVLTGVILVTFGQSIYKKRNQNMHKAVDYNR